MCGDNHRIIAILTIILPEAAAHPHGDNHRNTFLYKNRKTEKQKLANFYSSTKRWLEISVHPWPRACHPPRCRAWAR
jgi:hypothetical protein